MDALLTAQRRENAPPPDRPFAFLVSTTGCATDIRRHMGSADYSYTFVLEALQPVLERLGTWRLIDRPESRLAHAARQSIAAGYRPLHLALHPPQNIHHVPEVPTVLFPFWEFPEIPNRDFQNDTRQNWVRMCRTASLILTASRSCAEAFRRGGVTCPIEVVPVPVSPEYFSIPEWDEAFSWTLSCRHLQWGGSRGSGPLAMIGSPDPKSQRNPIRATVRAAKRRFRRHVQPWLSERSLRALARFKRMALRRPEPEPPRLPVSELTLEGLVFTTIFNFSDRRKNPRDLLTAFLLAFRDRADVTLVLKLATSASREWIELHELEALYRSLGIDHACRVVVITDYLTNAQMTDLYRATTFYVNTSHAEGACLPLQRALAAGRPAIAPDHTAMSDYMDEHVGFVVRSFPEPTFWPHDPERRCETSWNRLVWSNLYDALRQAATLTTSNVSTYRSLARSARARMAGLANNQAVYEKARLALRHLERVPGGEMGHVDRVSEPVAAC